MEQIRARDLAGETEWNSLAVMREKFDRATLDPWTLLLMQQFLTLKGPREQLGRPLSGLEKTCIRGLRTPHLLSGIYKVLLQDEEPGGDFWREWERDLGTPLNEQQRGRIAILNHKVSIASKTQEMGYKLLSRWYLTPSRLHRMFSNTSPLCWRCLSEEGTLFHIFWQCPKIRGFWTSVGQVMSEVTGQMVSVSPSLMLLHLNSTKISSYKKSLLAHLINAARAVIPRKWKRICSPTLRDWVTEVNHVMDMEDLTASMRGLDSRFGSTWAAWLSFRGSAKYKAIMSTE